MLGGFGHALGPDGGADGAAFVLEFYGVAVEGAVVEPGALGGEEAVHGGLVVGDLAGVGVVLGVAQESFHGIDDLVVGGVQLRVGVHVEFGEAIVGGLLRVGVGAGLRLGGGGLFVAGAAGWVRKTKSRNKDRNIFPSSRAWVGTVLCEE